MPILELARSKGKVQDYEMALNVRLAKRFYPTLELGYAIAETSADGGFYGGQGGFARLGMDLSALKKGAFENCLMVGLRFAGAYQRFQITDVPIYGDYCQWAKSIISTNANSIVGERLLQVVKCKYGKVFKWAGISV